MSTSYTARLIGTPRGFPLFVWSSLIRALDRSTRSHSSPRISPFRIPVWRASMTTSRQVGVPGRRGTRRGAGRSRRRPGSAAAPRALREDDLRHGVDVAPPLREPQQMPEHAELVRHRVGAHLPVAAQDRRRHPLLLVLRDRGRRQPAHGQAGPEGREQPRPEDPLVVLQGPLAVVPLVGEVLLGDLGQRPLRAASSSPAPTSRCRFASASRASASVAQVARHLPLLLAVDHERVAVGHVLDPLAQRAPRLVQMRRMILAISRPLPCSVDVRASMAAIMACATPSQPSDEGCG